MFEFQVNSPIFLFRYNYPLCEECNCDPSGVPGNFFAEGGCGNVAPGTLCTCKERVTGRICDTCKPLFWKLEKNNPDGCTGRTIYGTWNFYLSSF